MWFGTILYVHLLLKPAYASRGLPRGELIVGWGSIVLIAVTGTILTFYRIPSMDALLHTRFGRLLTAKIAIFLVMTSTAFIVTFVIGPRLKARHGNVEPKKGDMTAEELASFTGKDGTPGYIAYKGTIYDASNSRLWRGGSHLGKHQAGFDLTGFPEARSPRGGPGFGTPDRRQTPPVGGAGEDAAAPEGVLLHDLLQPFPRAGRTVDHLRMAVGVNPARIAGPSGPGAPAGRAREALDRKSPPVLY